MTLPPDDWILKEAAVVPAEKRKSSMAMPCAPPWLSDATQTNHKAASGGQLVIARLVTARLTWFEDWVPSSISKPPGLAGKPTSRLCTQAVTLVESRLVADTSTV